MTAAGGPEVLISDTGSYSDMVFGLLKLLGVAYRPELADLPDQKLWRVDVNADYGPLDAAARGKIDLSRIKRHWPDILRIVGSVHDGAVSASDVMRMLQHGSSPTQLGIALAHFGRIFKTLHVLSYVDAEPYRRDIKRMRNLQEQRHGLAKHVFHGRKGERRTATPRTRPPRRSRPVARAAHPAAARSRRPGRLMRARDIQPGHQYARARAGYLPDQVTVTSVTAQRVSYVDEHGQRGHARPGEITGPWQAHAAALARAEAAREALRAAAGEQILGAWLAYRGDRSAVGEDDEFGITVQLTPGAGQPSGRPAPPEPLTPAGEPAATPARPDPVATCGSRRPGRRRARR